MTSGTPAPSVVVAPPRPTRAPWILFGALVAVGVAILVLIPVLVPDVGFGVAYHEVCETGAVVDTEVFWTPVLMLNSPYQGSAWANGSGSGINATNGQAMGLFAFLHWDLFTLYNGSVAGPGISSPCSSKYAATYSPSISGQVWEITAILLPRGSTDDSHEETSFSATNQTDVLVPSVIFDNTPYTPTSGGLEVNTCVSETVVSKSAGSAVYPITVPFAGVGNQHYLSVLFPSSVGYSYIFPVGGAWSVQYAETDTAGGYEGGWTFQYHSCTMVPPPGAA